MTESKPSRRPVPKAYLVAICALLFNGIGAFYGGYSLVHTPDGSGIGLDIALLRGSGFTNYRIPGIILLVVNGLIDTIVLVALLFRVRRFHLLVVGQGVLLLGWLAIQVILIHTLDQMHFIMGATAIALIVSGVALISYNSNNS